MTPGPAAAAEPPIPVGNHYPKYQTRNPIARLLVGGFLESFRALSRISDAADVLEAGCGEGYLSAIMAADGRRVRGIDISPRVVEQARANPVNRAHGARFEVGSVYDLKPGEDDAELVVCCEVLEHLVEPETALRVLVGLAKPYLLVSVPREPVWRVLNMLSGRYLDAFGNTPGHLQHWSKRSFLTMLGRHAEIVAVRSPLPWTMALCRAPGGRGDEA
ncbi:MAG: class I SAM-dependent methyltransferase [Inquilinus sp.]|nr:class I SAM-dependent methyltransferase [Inquilinus sp.]